MGPKHSMNRGSVLLRPTRRIIPNFLLVWLDTNLNESTPDFNSSLAQLRHIVVSIETYNDAQQCIQFMQQVKDQQVFLIVSGKLGKKVVSQIHEWNQIDSIYIFCSKKTSHEKWSGKYPKVKGVYTDITRICERLKYDSQQFAQNMIPMSFQNIDPLFMYTQLVKEAVLQIEYDDAESIKELSEYCRQNYKDKLEDQVREFETKYTKEKAIWWYTAPYFLYLMLNAALREFDVEILMKMGFFISHLHRHIQHLSEQQQHADPTNLKIIGKKQFELYRGQGLSHENFAKLKQCKGGLVSFNNFLSTSSDRDVSLHFAMQSSGENTVGILFVMQIDTDLCRKANIPFVEITGTIGFYEDSEAEVLFTTHTLFEIETVQSLTHSVAGELYQVNLKVVSPETNELKEVANSINKEIGYRKGFSRLAAIFLKSGLSEQAKDIYHLLLDKATTDKDIAEYHYQLGWVYNELGEHKKAIQYYELNLEYKKKTLAPNDLEFAASYNNIGLVYNNMGEYSKALASYEQSLEIKKRILPSNHLGLAASYNNIGLVHKSMGDYSKALASCRQSLEIREKLLPPNHPDLAASYNNVGMVFENTKEYVKALSYYERALQIFQNSLPAEHPHIALVKRNIQSARSKI